MPEERSAQRALSVRGWRAYLEICALMFSNSIAAPSAQFSGPCSIKTIQQKVAATKSKSQSNQRTNRTGQS
jgi:hypothetical protein